MTEKLHNNKVKIQTALEFLSERDGGTYRVDFSRLKDFSVDAPACMQNSADFCPILSLDLTKKNFQA